MPSHSDNWTLIEVAVSPELSELVSDHLWSIGVAGIEETTRGDTVVLRTSVGSDPHEVIAHLSTQFPSAQVGVVDIPRSIADSWRDFAEASHVVDDIWLVPAWTTVPANSRPILVEPLDTFGLGNHPTTVLTLRLALANLETGGRVLDMGSGSGVLSVGLAVLRGAHVDAHDIAASGADALRINAALNDVETVNWCAQRADIGSNYDMVMANILAPVLRELSDDIQSRVRPGGVVVLSGIRNEQVDEVLTHYAMCDEKRRITMDGWSAVALIRVR